MADTPYLKSGFKSLKEDVEFKLCGWLLFMMAAQLEHAEAHIRSINKNNINFLRDFHNNNINMVIPVFGSPNYKVSKESRAEET